jgi:hypothetical protein
VIRRLAIVGLFALLLGTVARTLGPEEPLVRATKAQHAAPLRASPPSPSPATEALEWLARHSQGGAFGVRCGPQCPEPDATFDARVTAVATLALLEQGQWHPRARHARVVGAAIAALGSSTPGALERRGPDRADWFREDDRRLVEGQARDGCRAGSERVVARARDRHARARAVDRASPLP